MADNWLKGLAALLGVVATILVATAVAEFESFISPALVDNITSTEMGFLAFIVGAGAVAAYLYAERKR